MNAEPITTQDKRLLDEGSFQRLLEAAYVLQIQSKTSATKEPVSNHTQTLAEIVELQNLILTEHLELDAAMKAIAERALRITAADGAAIGVVEQDQVYYRAGTGSAAVLAGSCVAVEASLAARSLRQGRVLQSAHANHDPQFDAQVCRQRAAASVITVPFYHEGKVAGVLELVCARPETFQEHDVRACQLLAGLVTEAVARSAEKKWKQALAVERATMLEALEMLKPQLERLAEEPESEAAAVEAPTLSQVAPEPVPESRPASIPVAEPIQCRNCGQERENLEVFCGACGAPRDPGEIPNKWTTLWHLRVAEQQAHIEETTTEDFPSMDDIRAELERALPDLAAAAAAKSEKEEEDYESELPSQLELPVEGEVSAETAAEPEAGEQSQAIMIVPESAPAAPAPEVWSSAAKARQWLDSLKAEQPAARWVSDHWRAHRANIYLAAASILLLVVIFARPQPDPAGTVMRSAPGRAAVHRDPRQNLTLFEKMLVGIGLAEAPPAPAYQGNPSTQVWVDLHTALYYCPGSELYGKTPKGKFTTQKDAQQDQFEPALRKACE